MSRKQESLSKLFPLETPNPDFQKLKGILAGEEKADRVHFVELGIDIGAMQFILDKMMDKDFPVSKVNYIRQQKIKELKKGKRKSINLLTTKEEKDYTKSYIELYYRIGYDFVPGWGPIWALAWLPEFKTRTAKDTAALSKSTDAFSGDDAGGKRVWIEEKKGIITSWEDFEKFNWERLNMENTEINMNSYYEFISENLPEGMKIVPIFSLYEIVADFLLGPENLYYLLYDQPDLVEAVINEWGRICYQFYEAVLPFDCVGAIWHADDLGHKSGANVNPELLRKLLFPWYKKYASLAHQHGKQYWVHVCGNVLELMEDYIEDVEIDAFHSFQDTIIPVTQFSEKYGKKVGTLGGVDMDKLCRLDKESLRKYVREILQECMRIGRYALGSGNTITNYMPISNYLAMLEEGLKWKQG